MRKILTALVFGATIMMVSGQANAMGLCSDPCSLNIGGGVQYQSFNPNETRLFAFSGAGDLYIWLDDASSKLVVNAQGIDSGPANFIANENVYAPGAELIFSLPNTYLVSVTLYAFADPTAAFQFVTLNSPAPTDPLTGGNPTLPQVQLSETPLPSTWLMLISGFVGLGFFAYCGTKQRMAFAAA